MVLICGGPRVTNLLASELGYDAGFGRGTLPSEVAAFIAVTLAHRLREESASERRSRRNLEINAPNYGSTTLACKKPRSSPASPAKTARISPSCCLEKGYRVVGMTRRTSTEVHERIEHIVDDIEIVSGDLLDQTSMTSIVNDVRPDEIYNLAAQSFVPTSWNQPVLTGEFTALGVTRVLEAVRHVDPIDSLLSGLEFRNVRKGRRGAANRDDAVLSAQPVRRCEGLRPLDHRQLSRVVRHVSPCSGILFNHESPRRGKEFVTRKISDGVARIKLGLANELRLGNFDAQRDWGFRRRLRPRDVADAAGRRARRLRHCDRADAQRAEFRSHRLRSAGLGSYEPYVVIDPRFVRPAEVDVLIGDPGKAKRKLGWAPEVTFEQLVEMMVKADLDRLAERAPA